MATKRTLTRADFQRWGRAGAKKRLGKMTDSQKHRHFARISRLGAEKRRQGLDYRLLALDGQKVTLRFKDGVKLTGKLTADRKRRWFTLKARTKWHRAHGAERTFTSREVEAIVAPQGADIL